MQHGYLELKLSWELFEKAPESLSKPERSRLAKIAARQELIERRILASAEAASVVVPAATLCTRLQEIHRRYAGRDELARDLERIGLSEAALDAAVERDLCVEAILEKVGANAEPVTAVDAELYYHLHPRAFCRPEARRVRHILVTFNNVREEEKARSQLEVLRLALRTAESFGAAAQRDSHCPTAMDGGRLGVVKPGQLFAQLEAAAFALHQGQISRVLESPIGLHILRCDEIIPSVRLSFAEVSDRIVDRLFEERRGKVQREWIAACLPG